RYSSRPACSPTSLLMRDGGHAKGTGWVCAALLPSWSFIPRNAVARRGGGVEGATNVAGFLRPPHRPQPLQLGDRVVVPVDSQVGDRPGDLVHDPQPARTDRPFLAACPLTGTEGVEESPAEVVLWPLLEGLHHSRRDSLVGEQVAGGEAVVASAAAVPAERV